MNSLLILAIFSLFASSYQLSCLNHVGAAVPWFFMIKYPNVTDQTTGETHRYAYYDSVKSSSGEANFELRTNYVDIEGEALYETFNQANKNSALQIIAWNDEPAVSTSEAYSSTTDSYTAHSKGVIIYDSAAGNGLYLPHSTPKYPAVSDSGINITVGWSQRVYGQNYLCLSLDKENLEKVAEGLLLTGVTVYYNSFKDTSGPNMYQLGQNPPASSSSDNFKTIPFTLGSLSLPIIGFYKNPYYQSGFIFEDAMVPYLQDSLLVESWGRPYQAPSCNLAGGFEADNIVSIKLCNDEEGTWINKDDHSKWAVTKNKHWVCSGGMNRMTSQAKRGGAFFCFVDDSFWKVLTGVITQVDACGSSAEKAFLQMVQA